MSSATALSGQPSTQDIADTKGVGPGGRRADLVILGHSFKTKKALLVHLRGIRDSVPVGGSFTAAQSTFLSEALRLAQSRYGLPAETPVSWSTRWASYHQGARRNVEFTFARPDGTHDNPSIARLAQSLPEHQTRGPQADNAARLDVAAQIEAFRTSAQQGTGVYRCASCSQLGVEGFDVDHAWPPFKQLWQRFAAASHSTPEAEETYDEKGFNIGLKLREPHRTAWLKFHAEHATLQILCRNCHYEKTASDRKAGFLGDEFKDIFA